MENIVIAILSKYNISFKLKRNGREAEFLCPFHDDRTPSMSMNTLTGKWHCFSCKAGGISIQSFVKKLYGDTVDLSTIVSESDILQLKIHNKYQKSHERLRSFDDYLDFKKICDDEMRNFEPAIESNIAMDYLSGPRRKLTVDTIQRFRLMFAKEGFYAGRIIIPYYEKDRLIGFNARLIAVDKGGGKDLRYRYLVHKQSLAKFVFEHEHTTDKKTAVLVEGPFDLMWSVQCGIQNVISTLSTGVSMDHIEKLIEYKNLVFCFDNDENKSGEKAVHLAAKKILLVSNRKIFKVDLPPGKDPNDCTPRELKDAFLKIKRIVLKEEPENSVSYGIRNSSRWNFLVASGEKTGSD